VHANHRVAAANLALVGVRRPAQDSFNAFLKLVELDGLATKLAVLRVTPNMWSIWSYLVLQMTMGALVNVRTAVVKKGPRRRAASGPR
jgi:hypothetical protein